MSPLEYLFSKASCLDELGPQPATILSLTDVPFVGFLSTPAENSIAFEGRPDLKMWAFYRLVNEHIEIASPFGCCHLPCKGLDASMPIGLMNSRANGDLSSWEIQVDPLWKNARGEVATPESLKARPLSDGSFEPLHTTVSFRGIGSKPDFWSVVLLPSRAERIYPKNGGACIEAGDRLFFLPPGKSSSHVLAGRVQWGLPDESGFFALLPR